MFNFNELKQIHLEITNNCQASCPMCSRNINGGLENPLIKINSWSLEDYKTIVSPKVLNQLSSIYFCGNFGDPILNKDLLEMCEYTSLTSPDVRIDIHTNGSARNSAWWKKLASILPKNHRVVFALDGLQDTHSIYRIGTEFDQIICNATDFISAGGIAEWCFIKFKHNEHQTETARDMASTLGFETFTIKNSSRFILDSKYPVKNAEGNTVYFIEPSTDNKMIFIDKTIIENYKKIVENTTINCYVQNLKEIYIDAYRNVFPCCWLASTPYNYISEEDPANHVRFEINKQYYDLVNSLGGINRLNAVDHSIQSIIDNNVWQNVWEEYWTTKKLITCVRSCGVTSQFSKPDDQFIEKANLDE